MTAEDERDLSSRAWAAATFGRAALPDQRLVVRLLDLAEHFAEHPGDTIPAAQEAAKRSKACYRFFRNERASLKPSCCTSPWPSAS